MEGFELINDHRHTTMKYDPDVILVRHADDVAICTQVRCSLLQLATLKRSHVARDIHVYLTQCHNI
jgi:hypothetical protein